MLCTCVAGMLACLHKRAYAWSERLFMSKAAALAAVSTPVRLCEWRVLNGCFHTAPALLPVAPEKLCQPGQRFHENRYLLLIQPFYDRLCHPAVIFPVMLISLPALRRKA